MDADGFDVADNGMDSYDTGGDTDIGSDVDTYFGVGSFDDIALDIGDGVDTEIDSSSLLDTDADIDFDSSDTALPSLDSGEADLSGLFDPNDIATESVDLLQSESGVSLDGPDNAEYEYEADSEKILDDVPFTDDGTLKPNIEYTAGEYDYLYKTDDQGRITDFKADNLQLTERDERLPHDSNTPDKGEDDHAGHLIADRFGGSPELDNLVSQHSYINQGEYKAMENEWAEAIKEGSHVEVAADVIYDGDSSRPSSFDVFYAIDGEVYQKSFINGGE